MTMPMPHAHQVDPHHLHVSLSHLCQVSFYPTDYLHITWAYAWSKAYMTKQA